jgi:tetratricopeptide (TPR) repeat protein
MADNDEAERKAVGRQVGIIVGAGALLVIVLFMISAVSSNSPSPATPGDTGAASTQTTPATPNTPPSVNQDPLPPQVASQAEELRAQIEAATGPERGQLLTDLVQLLASAGRLDLAATEQQRLAELQNTAAAWRHAGNLYYDWMMTVEDQGRRAEIAQQSIAAYREVVSMEPGNLDARTDMAVAYLNTNNPMQGVEEITAVLDQDSTHVPARFNYGVMLAMIGRTEKAQQQFRLVQQIVNDSQSPYHQRAEEALQTLQEAPSGTL